MRLGSDKLDPARVLRGLRFVWVVIVLTQTIFAAHITTTDTGAFLDNALFSKTSLAVTPAAFVVFVPLAFFMRNQIYKANWVGHAITPRGYFTGNVVFYLLLWLAAVTAFVGGVAGHDSLWALIVIGMIVAIMGFNFPTGQPMRDKLPRIKDKG